MDTGFREVFAKSRALMIYLRVHEASFGGGAPPPALRPWTTGPAALPTGCACRFAGLRLDKVPRLPTASTPPTLNKKAFNSNPLQNTAGGPRHEVRGGAAPGGRGAAAPPLGVQLGPLGGLFLDVAASAAERFCEAKSSEYTLHLKVGHRRYDRVHGIRNHESKKACNGRGRSEFTEAQLQGARNAQRRRRSHTRQRTARLGQFHQSSHGPAA